VKQKDLKLSPKGLYLGPSHTSVPSGAMAEALNCVLRKVGRIDPRPGFQGANKFTSGTGTEVVRFLPVDGDEEYAAIQNDGSEQVLVWSSDLSVPDAEGVNDRTFSEGFIKSAIAKKHLYLSTEDALRKVFTRGTPGMGRTEGTTLWKVGLTPAAPVVQTAGGSGAYVAYRLVTRHTDEAGNVIRSAPSGRYVTASADSGPPNNLLRLFLHRAQSLVDGGGDEGKYPVFRVGQVVEVYRTLAETTATPTDYLYQVGEVEITQDGLDDGYMEWTDNTQDTETGQALYTNPDQEGTEGAHTYPPSAKTLAVFNGSLFAGNVSYRPETTVAVPLVDLALVQLTNSELTNGLYNVVVSDTSNLKVGMIVGVYAQPWDSTGFGGSGGMQYPRITQINSSTDFNMSHSWSGTTGSSYTLLIYNSIRVSDGLYDCYLPVGDYFMQAARGNALPGSLADLDPVCPVVVDGITDAGGSVVATPQYRISGITGDDLEIWATNGDSYNPPLPEPTETNGYSVEREEISNGLAWTNQQEPDHFRDDYFEYVGPSEEILALVTVNNSLLVFFPSGIWRCSGSGASSGFRFDQLFGESLRLLTPDCVSVLNDRGREMVCCWTDSGVFLGDENGFEDISNAQLYLVTHDMEQIIRPGNTDAAGAWIATNNKDGEILLSVPAKDSLDTGDQLYVYNSRMQGWTRWFEPEAGLVHGLGRKGSGLVLQIGDLTQEEVLADDTAVISSPWAMFLDGGIPVTVTGSVVDGNGKITVVISSGSGWIPAVGDNLYYNDGDPHYLRVLSVDSDTDFETDEQPPNGAATAYSVVPYKMTFTAGLGGDPSALKHWGEGATVWDAMRRLRSISITFSSSISPTEVTETRTVNSAYDEVDKAEAIRFTTPKKHSRSSRLYVTVRIDEVGVDWSLSAVAIQYRVMGSRVENKVR